jgi:hypothetical protein
MEWQNFRHCSSLLALAMKYHSYLRLQFGGGTDNPSVLGYDIMIDMYRHGPVMRMYLLW